MWKTRCLSFFLILIAVCVFNPVDQAEEISTWSDIQLNQGLPGKTEWQPMLNYVLELHQGSTHKAAPPFTYDWEEIGPGYGHGPAFGHWDIVHQVIDVLHINHQHALQQLLNNIENQEPTGLLPGSIWMPGSPRNQDQSRHRRKPSWSKTDQGHPPVWVYAVDDYVLYTGEESILSGFLSPLIRQITWFENSRKAETTKGFFYNDILLKKWESGVDEGIRFDEAGLGKWASVDATAHVYALYSFAEKWSLTLGQDERFFTSQKEQLEQFIQSDLWAEEEAMFFDIWAVEDPSKQHLSFENFWPIIVGAASFVQAERMIDKYLMNPDHFLTAHPAATVSLSDRKFERRMWRGPTWNSMTYWLARGCIAYGREDVALILLSRALDRTNFWYEETGTIWEFYDPEGLDPRNLKRKPGSARNMPYRDYLGHNPVIEMARLYDRLMKEQ